MSAARKTAKMPTKPYWEMNLEELREATKEFDKEMVIDTFRPLTPQERKHWEKVQAGLLASAPNRKTGKRLHPAEKIAFTTHLTPELLEKIDTLAKHWKFSRAKTIRTALDRFLAGWFNKSNRRKGSKS